MKTNPMAIVSAALAVVAVVVEVAGFVLLVLSGFACMAMDCPDSDAPLNATIIASFLIPASALVTGVVARRQITHSQGAQRGGFGVLVGTALGGFLLAGNVLLAAVIFLAP